MTVINRYRNTIRGGLYQIGNTMGLYSTSTVGVGNLTTATPAPPSGGTTTSFLADSNAINVQVPSGTVVYAELTWCCASSTPTQSLPAASDINRSIFIKDPKGVTTTVPINPATTQSGGTVAPGQWASYAQSTAITSIIQNGGNGFYTLSQIPVVIGGTGSGFTINIVYQDNTLPFRNINIWSLFDGPALGSTLNIPLTGFATPSEGTVTGRLTVGAANGNSEQAGDFVRFGPTVASAVTLSGPNNPANNFFSSQINNNAGNLDTTGTWGNSNASPGVLPPNGARTWYDTTNVDASSGLTINQTTAQIVLGTTSDYYTVAAVGLQVDVNSASFTPVTKSVDRNYGSLGDSITYTVTFKNTGLVTANNVIFIDTIPNGGTFTPDTFVYNGTTITGVNPNPPGVSLGAVPPNGAVTISFKINVTTLPSPNPMLNTAGLSYNFVSAPGLSPINAFDTSNTVSTTINNGDLSSAKTVDKAYAKVGDILTYTIVLTNVGNVSTNNIQFVDVIPQGTALVPNSFKENGNTIANANPDVAVPLQSINVKGVTTVTFKVQITTMPNPNPIVNQSRAIYVYYFSPSQTGKSGDNYSNSVFTQVNRASLGNATKYVDKNYANCGDTINYTIVIPNSGNVTAENVVFKDTIPSGTTFVTNSVTVNGTQQSGANPSLGVAVPNIAPGGSATITFAVQVQC